MIQTGHCRHYVTKMNHREIDEKEIIERYVRQQLSLAERRAFQEHYFTCDACFDKVQMTARLIAGVRDAGVLMGKHQ